jgi:hypothetical protein
LTLIFIGKIAAKVEMTLLMTISINSFMVKFLVFGSV